MLTFFIVGLLYLLRFKRVDNSGAYSIPSETGLLIPSAFNSHRCNPPHETEETPPGDRASFLCSQNSTKKERSKDGAEEMQQKRGSKLGFY